MAAPHPGGGGNGILTSLDQAFGPGSYTLVSTANLETSGFLNSFDTLIVSRSDSDFGTPLTAAAAANVAAYVGSGVTQGGVALFTNDAADNFFGATTGDPFDANLNNCSSTRRPLQPAATTVISVSSTARSWE